MSEQGSGAMGESGITSLSSISGASLRMYWSRPMMVVAVVTAAAAVRRRQAKISSRSGHRTTLWPRPWPTS